jgi:hypothetical protein
LWRAGHNFWVIVVLQIMELRFSTPQHGGRLVLSALLGLLRRADASGCDIESMHSKVGRSPCGDNKCCPGL